MDMKLLKKIINEGGFSRKEIARGMNIYRFLLFFKLSGFLEFRLSEIKKISEILCLTPKQVMVIFFNKKVS